MIKNKLKLGLVVLAMLAVFGVASYASAAALTWTADYTVDLSSPDINLTILSGSEATSLVVGTGTVQVAVAEGDTFQITSADRDLNVSGVTSADIGQDCSSGTETITINGGADGETITITPGSEACSSGATGGGGGSSSHNDETPTPTPPGQTPVFCPPGQLFKAETGERCDSSTQLVFCPPGQMFNGTTGQKCNTTVSNPSAPGASGYTFGAGLVKQGTKGEACKAWQMFLNNKKGAGLAVDGWCGKLTIGAAKAWQTSVGLIPDGLLGPMSRAKAMMQ